MATKTKTFQINGRKIRAFRATMTVAEICTDMDSSAKVGRHQLFLESSGDAPDRMLTDGAERIKVDGLKFYTVPPACGG